MTKISRDGLELAIREARKKLLQSEAEHAQWLSVRAYYDEGRGEAGGSDHARQQVAVYQREVERQRFVLSDLEAIRDSAASEQ